jgi:hypothetical protein
LELVTPDPRKRARPEQTVAVSAHKDAIRESIGRCNVKRVVPRCPVANPRGDGESIPVAGSRAAIIRAEVKCRIRSRTAVELVVVGAFRLAGLGDCRTAAFGMNGGPRTYTGGAGLTLGFGGGRDGSHFRSTFDG